MTTRPVAVKVSQATRLAGSSVRQASRIASEIWSAILSGCPSVTDSEVNKWRFFDKRLLLSGNTSVTSGGGWSIHNSYTNAMFCDHKKATRERAAAQTFLAGLRILAASGVPS